MAGCSPSVALLGCRSVQQQRSAPTGGELPAISRPLPAATESRVTNHESRYTELHCHSVFSLLDGASAPEALLARAKALGMPALALTDHEDLGGAVRFATAARELGLDGIIGSEITLQVEDRRTHLVLLAESREGYGNIATLITRARMDTPRGEPAVTLDTLARHAGGLFALTGCPRGWVPSRIAAGDPDGACEAAATLLDIFGGRLAIEVWDHGLAEERELVRHLVPLAHSLDLPWVVTNDVHYAEPTDRIVHDVLCALRHQRTLDEMGTRLRPNGEWYLKSAAQMRRRWQHDDAGIRNTAIVAERCAFRLDALRPTLPEFPLPPGITADEYLARLVEQGARERIERQKPDAGGATQHPAPAISNPQPARSPSSLPGKYRIQIAHELDVIRRLGLAGYFLIVWDIVRFARRAGVLCQGRGSAANSVVCYCLGLTAIDPVKMELLFERFLSEERQEAPDIDIDFAHRDREKVLQYVYERYGREHAAMVCEHITYRGRSAARDTARVLGFSVEQANVLSALSDRFSAKATAEALRAGTTAETMLGRHYDLDPQSDRPAVPDDPRKKPDEWSAERLLAQRLGQDMLPGTTAAARAREEKAAAKREAAARAGRPEYGRQASGPGPVTGEDTPQPAPAISNPQPALESNSILSQAGLDPADRRVQVLSDIIEGLHQAPRHRSIHVGGFVLTKEPLRTVVPIEPASMPNRTVIQWERDDLDPAGLVKIDLLGLGMLTVLQDCLKYVRATRGVTIDLGQLDMTDQAVYDDLCRADTIGVFQVESRAQMNTLPRLQPRSFYDLVVEVALIRPGPIQGDMVNPYLRRRLKEEPVTYPHPSLEPVLRRTLGVPLFQEQGMQVAVTAAGFTPGEADVLRRAMGHKRSRERMAAICEKLIAGMERNGIPKDIALRIYNQINAFADYGFPESHAASFALIVYASAYLRHYYAPEFTAAILNAQPMGFYSVGTLVEDAKRHGVTVRSVDLTRSAWDHALECPDGRVVVPHDGVIETRGQKPETGAATRHPAPAISNQPPAHPPSSRSPPLVRLGLRLVRGLGAAAREKLERALEDGPFVDIPDVVRRVQLDQGALRALCEAGAFDRMVADVPRAERRRTALWRVLDAVRGDAGPLAPRRREARGRRPVAGGDTQQPAPATSNQQPATSPPLPVTRHSSLFQMSHIELTDADYRMTGLSLNGHPMRHLRPLLGPNGIRTAQDLLQRGRDGESVAHAGLVICRQRPGTAKGFVFLSLEDETGILNVVVTPKRFERQALLISTSPLLLVRGTLQVEHGVVNLRGAEFRALRADAGETWARSHDFH
ncbi:MAG TPA: PHP domain-containing protein [Gemmatimonadaceae bacterium]|nr:PHP domain-containing protein [Gemmatimonadaceae bacterium]